MNRQVEFLPGKGPDNLCGTSVFGHYPWMLYFVRKCLQLDTEAKFMAVSAIREVSRHTRVRTFKDGERCSFTAAGKKYDLSASGS